MPQLENFRLKVFRAVAEKLSFRKAAEQLFLTQPAITLQIKALEDDLGVRLLNRGAGQVSLTRQGAILLRYAQQISTIVAQAEHELAADEGEVSEELDLGVSTTIAQYVLPRLLTAFLGEHPRVRLSLHSGNTDRIVDSVIQDKVSVGLIEGPSRRRGIRSEVFMRDELVLITAPGYEPDQLSRDQLLQSNLLIREQGSGSRHVVEAALKKADIRLKSFKSVIALDSTEAIKSGVEAGLGIGFVSRWAISKELELGALKVAAARGVRAVRDFTLILCAGPGPQGAAGAFRRFVLERAGFLANRQKYDTSRTASGR